MEFDVVDGRDALVTADPVLRELQRHWPVRLGPVGPRDGWLYKGRLFLVKTGHDVADISATLIASTSSLERRSSIASEQRMLDDRKAARLERDKSSTFPEMFEESRARVETERRERDRGHTGRSSAAQRERQAQAGRFRAKSIADVTGLPSDATSFLCSSCGAVQNVEKAYEAKLASLRAVGLEIDEWIKLVRRSEGKPVTAADVQRLRGWGPDRAGDARQVIDRMVELGLGLRGRGPVVAVAPLACGSCAHVGQCARNGCPSRLMSSVPYGAETAVGVSSATARTALNTTTSFQLRAAARAPSGTFSSYVKHATAGKVPVSNSHIARIKRHL